MLRKSLNHITGPLSRALLHTVHIEDPWERFENEVPTELYGLGARHDFSWYLEGESDVQMHSPREILEWLRGCMYASDPEVFHEPDFWQHPCTFERLRIGDCEDFALWAWRKLIEIGYDAEFVAGRSRNSNSGGDGHPWESGHAWVHFRQEGRILLLDAVDERQIPEPLPVDDVRELYLPEVSVDAELRRYVYGGYYLLQQGWKGG